MTGSSIPERVAQIYYTYGLFCSSYPVIAITLALSVVLICCYPLLNVPLPGNIPTVVSVPLNINENNIGNMECISKSCLLSDTFIHLDELRNKTQKLPYVWAKETPFLYVQQIVMRIGVSPWNNNLKMWDAFRAPLQEVFRLIETIRNHEDPETKKTIVNHCYQIDGIKKLSSKARIDRVLPEYNCLLLSPANLWQQNLQSFSLDANIVNTIYNYQNIIKGKASIAEMAFGMHLRDTGIKRYPLRSRPRVLQYAVTIFYEQIDRRWMINSMLQCSPIQLPSFINMVSAIFITSLANKLRDMYPLYQDMPQTPTHEATLIYYPGQFNYHELVPLLISLVGIFLYVYFSVRKIEFIKSKLGLAACSVLTIAGSLSMSMGICFYCGFSLSLQGKEIFPYLVIIVGLENILVLTKSVTSTDSRLDVKIRLAQGLSKEGWSITKNLLTEITILTVSLFTFVPFIQEFSIYMIVSLISDYFVQMTFFAPILVIDVSRMEYLPEQNNKLHLKEYFGASYALNWRYSNGYEDNSFSPQRMTKSKSHPRLNGLAQNSPTDVVAKRNSNPGMGENRVPKRIRLVNMWARTRFFQRALMVWMLVWISMIVYNSGVVDYFITKIDKIDTSTESNKKINKELEPKESTIVNNSSSHTLVFSPLLGVIDDEKSVFDENDTIYLKHSHSRPWSRLNSYHWSAILSQYNETLAGKYLVLLPPTLVSHRVSPEVAAGVRHPEEKDPPPLRWQALAAALDPIDTLPEFDLIDGKGQQQWGKGSELPIYPTTPMEILLLTILCTISIVVIAYMMVVLYRCICSRHYAEWRASWSEDEEYRKIIAKQPAVQLVMEAVPLVVAGHSQEVECIVTDGEKIVSSCLQGNIKIWDSLNGEIITSIDRSAYFKMEMELYEKAHSKNVPENSDCHDTNTFEEIREIEAIQRPEIRLRRGCLNNHLSNIKFQSNQKNPPSCLSVAENTKYLFAKTYRDLYCSDERDIYEKEIMDLNKLNVNKELSAINDSDKNELLRSNHDKVRRNRSVDMNGEDWKGKAIRESPVWCLDYCNDLIILGCADGRLEFWEATSGKLKCVWWCMEKRPGGTGVTHVKALGGGRRICVALLTGHLSLFRLDAYNSTSGAQVDWRFSTAHRRTHKRTGSADSLRSAQAIEDERARGRMTFSYEVETSDNEEVVCVRVAHCRPHQQPITELHAEGGRVLTGGQDHVLKVFSSDLRQLFTLHGHCGPITSCFIDHATPTIAGSGSQDGLLCVWDLHTGACLYSMQAHDGAVTSLAYTASYVVSAGADERLCIWDRFQGHMLNSVHIGLNYMSRMLPLTHTLLVMGDKNGLTAYDLSSGEVIRRVLFGQSDGCIFVRQILPLKDAIVCDYANQLRIVKFPLVSRLDMKNE